MGIGFFLESKGDTLRFGRGGWDEGFVARAVFYKDRGQGAVVMINSNEGFGILDEVVRAVAKEYAWPGFFEDPKESVALAAGVLDGYAGEYTGKYGLRVRVARDGDALSLKVGEQPAILMRPESHVRFFSSDLDTAVSFLRPPA